MRDALFRRFYRNDVLSDKRLGDRAVADLIKEAIYRLKDPLLDYHQFSGHSLRRGFLTSAGRNKADLLKMIAQSRHARVDTVLDYVDDQHRFENHAGEHLLKPDFEQQSGDTLLPEPAPSVRKKASAKKKAESKRVSRKKAAEPVEIFTDAIGLTRPVGFNDFPGAVSEIVEAKTLPVMNRFK